MYTFLIDSVTHLYESTMSGSKYFIKRTTIEKLSDVGPITKMRFNKNNETEPGDALIFLSESLHILKVLKVGTNM